MALYGSSLLVFLVAAFSVQALQPQTKNNVSETTNGESHEVARVIGGDRTSITRFPWTVYVRTRKDSGSESNCGGSIILESWIMSAAHCFTDPITDHTFRIDVVRISIYAGLTQKDDRDDSDIQKNIIDKDKFYKQLFIPSDYKKATERDKDIALIKLEKPLILSSRVQPIGLASRSDFIPGKLGIVSGWGKSDPDGDTRNTLRYAGDLKLISREDCTRAWGRDRITDNMICYENDDKGSCGGDSGGPLVVGWGNSNRPPYKQIGIVSWGKVDCELDRPKVNVDVTTMIEWIRTITSDTTPVTSTPETCKDNSRRCSKLAARGKCKKQSVKRKCKKSCNQCDNSGDSNCNSPWVSIGNTGCFRFVNDRADWDDARNYCQRSGGDLAILDVESKRRDVVNYMERSGLRDGHTRWLGASDRSGSWRWVSNNLITSGWRRDAGEPDDDRGDDTCMYLYTGSYPAGRYTLLSDKECDDDKQFICQK